MLYLCDARGYTNRLLAADFWREDVIGQVMSVHHASGNASGALAALDRFVKRLHEEIGVAPMLRGAQVEPAHLDRCVHRARIGTRTARGASIARGYQSTAEALRAPLPVLATNPVDRALAAGAQPRLPRLDAQDGALPALGTLAPERETARLFGAYRFRRSAVGTHFTIEHVADPWPCYSALCSKPHSVTIKSKAREL